MKELIYTKLSLVSLNIFALFFMQFGWSQIQYPVSEIQKFEQLQSNSTATNSPLDAMKGKREDYSKRDAFSKHFKNEDGSFTAIIGAGPMHYNKNGKWEDISWQINQSTFGPYTFSNTSNILESFFGDTAHKGILSKVKEGEVQEFLETQMYWEVNGQKLGVKLGANVPAKVKGEKLYYKNLFGEIDAEFTIKSGQRKLNYIVPNLHSLGPIPQGADFLVFSEKIKLPDNFKIVRGIENYNKISKQTETITGIFILDENENVIYEYSAPEILENYNPEMMNIPSQISPELSFEKNSQYITLYTKVKASWILDAARTFPIAIDPTITAYPFATTYTSGQCYPTGGADGNIYAGYNAGWYRGWLTFNFSSLPSLSDIIDASMYLYVGARVGTMGSGSSNNIYIGHTSFDLSRITWLNTFAGIYNAITANNNALGAYVYMPPVTSTTSYTSVNLGSSSTFVEELKRKSGSDIAFMPVSFSPSWGSGTTNRMYGIYGYSDISRKPYLTITYNEEDKYKHAAYRYANAAAIGDVGYVQIGNVNIGTLNNTTAITNYAAGAGTIYRNTPTGYNKYNLGVNLNTGSSYTLNTTYRDLGSPYNSGKIAVWVDWNEDGDFADGNEYIGLSATTTSGNQVRSFTINVPEEASPGIKRLRIRSFLYDNIVNSFNYDTTYFYGETEDYDLIVDPILDVYEAYTGATHANGSHYITYNSTVTATAGTRTGFVCTGWVGIGNVPPTGATDTATFTITEHSSITWQWAAIGCLNTTIWDGMAWSNGAPTDLGTTILFEGDYSSDLDLNYPSATGLMGCSLEVRNDSEVNIASHHSVTIENEISVDNDNGAKFILNVDANLIQNAAGAANQGKIIVKQTASVPSIQYNYWSSPVIGQDLYALYPNIPNNRVMTYNTWNDYFSIVPAGSLSVFGKGYSIKGPSSGGPIVMSEFYGVPQNESLNPSENIIPLSGEGNRFNLIGNPYPSNLDLKKLHAVNSGQFYDRGDDTHAFFFWDNTNNIYLNQQGSGYVGHNYAMYNPVSDLGIHAPSGNDAKIPNGIVKPGQGFIIRAAASPTGILMDNDFRTKDLRQFGDTEDAPYYKNGGPNLASQNGSKPRKDKFWLELINPNDLYIQMAVGYFPEADHSFELYDSPILEESVSDNIYTFSWEGKKLSINGRRGPFEKEDVIPMGIKAFIEGRYRIHLDEKLGIFKENQIIYLHDKWLDIVHNLSESDYGFETETGVFEDRFEILFKPTKEPVLTVASEVKIQKRDEEIQISSTHHTLVEVEIYNLAGWLIYTNKTVNSKNIELPSSWFGKQILFVNAKTENGEIHSQKIIN